MKTPKTEKKIGEKIYWSAAKAAEYVGIHRSTIYTKARSKQITCLKLCGESWFLKEWLDSYIHQSTTTRKCG